MARGIPEFANIPHTHTNFNVPFLKVNFGPNSGFGRGAPQRRPQHLQSAASETSKTFLGKKQLGVSVTAITQAKNAFSEFAVPAGLLCVIKKISQENMYESGERRVSEESF